LRRLWRSRSSGTGLPDELALDEAAFAEPLVVAVHDVRRAAVRAGDGVLELGGGPIGLLIAAVAQAGGAHVLISEPNAFRRELADGLGLETIDPRTEDVVARVEDWMSGTGADLMHRRDGARKRCCLRPPCPRAVWAPRRTSIRQASSAKAVPNSRAARPGSVAGDAAPRSLPQHGPLRADAPTRRALLLAEGASSIQRRHLHLSGAGLGRHRTVRRVRPTPSRRPCCG